jgi:hypothetical protein
VGTTVHEKSGDPGHGGTDDSLLGGERLGETFMLSDLLKHNQRWSESRQLEDPDYFKRLVAPSATLNISRWLL